MVFPKANHNIFHFTGHGAYNQHQPQNSALTLAQKEQITAQEISQLNLKSYQLISLAACETAITGQETINHKGRITAYYSYLYYEYQPPTSPPTPPPPFEVFY